MDWLRYSLSDASTSSTGILGASAAGLMRCTEFDDPLPGSFVRGFVHIVTDTPNRLGPAMEYLETMFSVQSLGISLESRLSSICFDPLMVELKKRERDRFHSPASSSVIDD